MNEIKVVFSEVFGGFVPEVDGTQFNVVGESREDVQSALDENQHLVRAMRDKMEADDNHGLLFHMFGFDGDAQQNEAERLDAFFGVEVF